VRHLRCDPLATFCVRIGDGREPDPGRALQGRDVATLGEQPAAHEPEAELAHPEADPA
jgi:hypothetical protein